MIIGQDGQCGGPPIGPPKRATVRLSTAGHVVASQIVYAGDPPRQHFRLRAPAGQYVLTATNWPRVQFTVIVVPNETTNQNFRSLCD